MPVFLGLTHDQCRERKDHDRWLSLWQRWAKEDGRIILDDWKAVFKVFGYINNVSLCGSDEVKCREDIVDAICKEVSPKTRRDDSHVQGRSRMCKTLDERIGGMELSKRYKVRVLGLYGVGGIGKSTACMTLCNHYFEEFNGRVCHVEFGDVDELRMLQEILKRLTDTKHEQIDRLNKNECKHRMKNIKNQKIFLAMDNVFESHEIVQRAKLILRAGFAKSSIVIVTARSLGELQNLDLDESECMEMPELPVDDAISLFVQEVACDTNKSTNKHLIQQCVDRCYFSKGDGTNSHYLPLALRVLGGQLGSDSSQWLEKLQEIDVFNQYRERPDKHPFFSILRRSFDILQDEDKLLFMDCALFAFHYYYRAQQFPYEWLSMIHGKDLRTRLNLLKQKSLIETWEEGSSRIGIHDLWHEFCVMETKVGELKSRLWIYEGMSGSNIGESVVYNGVFEMAQRISLLPRNGRVLDMRFLSYCSNLVALYLRNVVLEGQVLDLNGVYNLKSLKIQMDYECEVRGLGLLRQLCVLEWLAEMPSNIAFIEEIGGLINLQVLKLSMFLPPVQIEFPNLSNLSLLQRVKLYGLSEGVSISCNSTMLNLRWLVVGLCISLHRCNGIGDLVNLEGLQIYHCPNLEALPNLQMLKNLKHLTSSECTSIQVLLGVGDLPALLELHVSKCPNLVEVPDLSKLTNLQGLLLHECKVVTELSELISLQACWISINEMGESNDLHNLTKLRSITIYGWSPQRSSGVDSLVNLEFLGIDDCRGVDYLGGLLKLTGLRSITLNFCEFKDVACLMDLIGLRSISIWGCDLLERFPNMLKATGLESLEIDCCENLQVWEGLSRERAMSFEAIGVDLHSGETFPNFQHLSLSYLSITELPDLSNFPKLQELRIFACRNLARLTSRVPLTNLKSFIVKHCKSLTTIPDLSGCKHLESVSMRDCRVTFSENEIQNLRVLCPTIDIDIDIDID